MEEQQMRKKIQANWNVIKTVKNAAIIPVLANGNIRHMDDVRECLEETDAKEVLSTETFLENPALFFGYWTAEWAWGVKK
ncbi:tRNA-dihydrouridine(16 17) synthase [NAD(P)(+)]-like [Olea europaea subsp. europaea]|uniref:tRNA-dihydrouridine(16 17) synthase [NAD(P)(+)]-like n=1 Tax=Olea europaea subsp. europaea TaxID=158383 RepID=A0A8S0QAN0_OLEEU|nr:tRNA-dihydrouridine(16 17) synthase [NAD(P)(+)]-like [Olea europaea subsp. europaea]